MEGMEDQRYSRLDGKDERLGILTFTGKSDENWKYSSRLVGMDGRLEILKDRSQGSKIGILKVRWKG